MRAYVETEGVLDGTVSATTPRSTMFGSRLLLAALFALASAAVPVVGLTSSASAAPSHWEPIDEGVSEEFEACPGLNVLWELTSTGKSRWTTRLPMIYRSTRST